MKITRFCEVTLFFLRFCDSQNLVRNQVKIPFQSFCLFLLLQKEVSLSPLDFNSPSEADSQNLKIISCVALPILVFAL